MRLSKTSKLLLCENTDLLDFCNAFGISIEKLKDCNIEEMFGSYLFVLPKENAPKSESLIPLDVDLDTQPDVVLVVKQIRGRLQCETTDKTIRLLRCSVG